jgi:formylglycine-generating enzyme required for sulfatase activity
MSRRSMGLVLMGLSMVLLLGSGWEPAVGAAESQPNWASSFYNPKPAEGDLVLPMPCGGAMVFRPVEVPSAGWLDDRRVELGQSDPRVGYKEGRRFSYIAGAFTDPTNNRRRYYYFAKYETTRDQYAVFDGQCPQPSPEGSWPVVGISWFDAVNFARRYTEWLLQNARAQLPVEGEQPGFLRLPTEEEWEFAARGGLNVDAAQFVAPVFPLPAGDLAQYAWYQGTQSAGGRLNAIGLLEPNPLGFYDILGNASEMVLVPFQLDHRGRPHGQAGGFVSKGGNIFTSRNQIRTAARDEHPYFDPNTGKATSLRALGFRLVLTAPVIVSQERLRKIQEEWTQLPDLLGTAGKEADQAMATLNTVANETKDENVRAELEIVQRDLEKAHTEINATRDRAVKAMIRMGAFLGNKVKTDNVRLNSIDQAITLARSDYERLREQVQGKRNAEQVLNEAKSQIGEMEKGRESVQTSLKNSLSYYGDMVIDVANDYSKEVIDPQLEKLKVEFRAKKIEYLIYYADLFVSHLKAYHESGKADTAEWLSKILNKGGSQR